MNRLKQLLFISIPITMLGTVMFSITNWYNTAEITWTYLKYKDNLYVLNTPETLEPPEVNNLTQIGIVEREISRFFKPESNNVSNGLRKGTEIFIDNRTSETYALIIKFKDKFYKFVNTANADGWGNGIMVRLH